MITCVLPACRRLARKAARLSPSRRFIFAIGLVSLTIPLTHAAPYQMENLGRGVVAMRTGSSTVYVGWRHLGLDPSGLSYNVYRGSTKVNASPITNSTNLVDSGANLSVANTYTVRPVLNGVEQTASAGYTLAANSPTQNYLRVALQRPAGGTTPDGDAYDYSPNDCSAADLDGDGEYEIVVKWDPSNAHDNSHSGYTGNVYLDGYKLNGTRLWRIDLGRNIRAGAHYTQFMVYDLDGDGKAEVACKTADATRDNAGTYIGSSTADHRNSSGYILTGPEYFTIFNGQTGNIMATTNYVPARGTVSDWGDSYGNRVDRFLAGIAYLDGTRPSVVMCRGYYTRTALVAWDWRNGQLTQRWVFDTGHSTSGSLAVYRGEGAHSLSIADLDNDGKQEIVYGAAAIDDDGMGHHAPDLGHGDALHVSDMNPNRSGLEIFMPHEYPPGNGNRGTTLRDGNNGSVLWSTSATTDVGRGCAGDIDSRYAGYELWASNTSNLYSSTGAIIGARPNQYNFMVYWDADLKRELLNGTSISKWNETAATTSTLLTAADCSSNNSTKATPNLSADLFGDWREEVIWRENGNDAIRIYTTTDVTTHRIHTLMHDPQYRVAIAWQNTAYNQPPHPGFYLGSGMGAVPTPAITYVGGGGGGTSPTYGAALQAEDASNGGGVTLDSNNAGFNGSGFANFPTTGGFVQFTAHGGSGGSGVLAIRHALGASGTRSGLLIVNGVSQNITFSSTGAWTTWQDHNVNISLNNGASNTIRFESNGQDLTNIDQITFTLNATPDTYQAESATAAGGVTIDSNNTGYNGTGFANFPTDGGTLTFNNVDGNGGGTKSLAIRYANGGTGARAGNLVINGATSAISFPTTGSFTTWATLNVNVTLNNNATNTIRLASTGSDLANIDEITVP